MPPKITSRSGLAAVALTAALLGAGAPAAYAARDAREAAPAAASPIAEGRPYIETTLLFGTIRPNGGPPVTKKEFRAFVDEFITPRFPDGLTVEEAYGQYRDAHGTIERERSYKVTLLYPTSQSRPNDPKIEKIRAEYLKRFDQESVARIDDRKRVDF
ncbi:DUF3574 domain-containing protein [Streptomyces chattanoogensis]|uniref:DUF3574 domain-containing protein n=1 Tax=Streptomyces chattanoogensis TaxID=66876 RepID=UPI0036C514A8